MDGRCPLCRWHYACDHDRKVEVLRVVMFIDQVHSSLLWRHAQFIASIHVALVNAFATFSLDADKNIVDLTDMEDEPLFAWESLLASLADVSVVGFKVMLVHGCARESLFAVT